MNNRDFVYWLNGFLELSGSETLDKRQVDMIKDHLNLCFIKETPDRFTVVYDIPDNQTC